MTQGLDIEERLRAVCGHLNVLNAQLVELAAEALATGSWQALGGQVAGALVDVAGRHLAAPGRGGRPAGRGPHDRTRP